MDYLLSLVGKDEATIVDAIKDLAANSEKVKAQDIEINELSNQIDENKEEIHFLKNKLDKKYDLIEDIENELENVERKLREAQEKVKIKETEFSNLTMLITDQVEEINILRDNNQSMVGQISENIQMENTIKHQNELLRDLKQKLALGTVENDAHKKAKMDDEENLKLQKEIKELQNINAEKAKELEKLANGNKVLEAKLEELESGIVEGRNSLAQELKDVEKRGFICEECKYTFELKSELKLHMRNMHELALWKSKLLEIETQNSRLKYKLSLDLFRIKEIEEEDKESCSCRGFCAISHSKHNWKRSLCDEIFCKMEKISSDGAGVNMHQCKTCETKFTSPLDFINHIESYHKVADVKFLES